VVEKNVIKDIPNYADGTKEREVAIEARTASIFTKKKGLI
jgi:hypothetical protein